MPHPTPVSLGDMQSVRPASSLWQKTLSVYRKRERNLFFFAYPSISYHDSKLRILWLNWKSIPWWRNVFNAFLRKEDKHVWPSLLYTMPAFCFDEQSSVQYRQLQEGFWNGNEISWYRVASCHCGRVRVLCLLECLVGECFKNSMLGLMDINTS